MNYQYRIVSPEKNVLNDSVFGYLNRKLFGHYVATLAERYLLNLTKHGIYKNGAMDYSKVNFDGSNVVCHPIALQSRIGVGPASAFSVYNYTSKDDQVIETNYPIDLYHVAFREDNTVTFYAFNNLRNEAVSQIVGTSTPNSYYTPLGEDTLMKVEQELKRRVILKSMTVPRNKLTIHANHGTFADVYPPQKK